jgi:hypothetical protein
MLQYLRLRKVHNLGSIEQRAVVAEHGFADLKGLHCARRARHPGFGLWWCFFENKNKKS